LFKSVIIFVKRRLPNFFGLACKVAKVYPMAIETDLQIKGVIG
tara:strand:- start:50 stop:178 length:129 start_codon:yes stop_codon:yes gene_type:complete